MPNLRAMMVSGGRGAGNLTGANPYAYEPAYGGIPQVPNPAASAGSAITANLGNLSQLYNLTGGVNDFMAGQAANQLALNLPNYNALIGQRSGVIGQELAGQVPQDVIDLLIQGAAERGIATGSPMSPNSNASYLRALGLTSIGQQQSGMRNLLGAIESTPKAQLMSPQSMMVSPDAIQEAQMAANLYASAPQPGAAARAAMAAGTVNYPGGGPGSGLRMPSFGGYAGGSPYHNASPDYGPAIVSGGGTNYQDAWNNPNSYGNLYQGSNQWNNQYTNPNSWSAPQGTWYDPIGDAYNAPSYGSGGHGFQDFPGFTQSGYDPIMDVSTSGPSWWDTMSGGQDYYGFAGADFSFPEY